MVPRGSQLARCLTPPPVAYIHPPQDTSIVNTIGAPGNEDCLAPNGPKCIGAPRPFRYSIKLTCEQVAVLLCKGTLSTDVAGAVAPFPAAPTARPFAAALAAHPCRPGEGLREETVCTGKFPMAQPGWLLYPAKTGGEVGVHAALGQRPGLLVHWHLASRGLSAAEAPALPLLLPPCSAQLPRGRILAGRPAAC